MKSWIGVALIVCACAWAQERPVPATARCCNDPNWLMDVEAAVCVDGEGLVVSPMSVVCNNATISLDDEFTIVVRSDDTVLLVKYPIEEEMNTGEFCLGNTSVNVTAATAAVGWQVALLCAEEETEPAGVDQLTAGVVSLVSIPFLLLTIAVYALLPELRDLQGKSVMCLCSALTISLAVLAHSYFIEYRDMESCAAGGFIRYYFTLASFFWMSCITIQVVRTVRCSEPVPSGAFTRYCAAGWVAPAALLALLLLLNYAPGVHASLVPGFGHVDCWFYGPLHMWLYFYGPMTLSVILNCVLFAWTSWILWRHTFASSKMRDVRYKLRLSLRLFVVTGVGWLFEPLSFLHGRSHIVWFIADVWNLLQGVLMFVVLVMLRRRALRGLARRHLLPRCLLPRNMLPADATSSTHSPHDALDPRPTDDIETRH